MSRNLAILGKFVKGSLIGSFSLCTSMSLVLLNCSSEPGRAVGSAMATWKASLHLCER